MTAARPLLARLHLWLHFVVIVVVAALPAAAVAHALRVSVVLDADGARGRALYADGTPAREVSVSLYEAGNEAKPVTETRTDADGRFRVALAAAGTYRIVVEGEEGHRTEARIVWSQQQASGGAASADLAAVVGAAVRNEAAPLREDIARLEERIWFAELVGSVGILIGLAGASAWWRARRRN